MTNQGPREIHVILHPKEIFIGARYAGSEIEARKAASLQTAWRRGSIPIIVGRLDRRGVASRIWLSLRASERCRKQKHLEHWFAVSMRRCASALLRGAF
jgi:hypothetical protein